MTEEKLSIIGGYTTAIVAILAVTGLLLFLGRTEHEKSMAAIEKGVVWTTNNRQGYMPR